MGCGWGGCSYHSGQTFGVGDSTGRRRCTCRGGSCAGSKLRGPGCHSPCKGQDRAALRQCAPPSLPGQFPPSPLVLHPPAPLVVLAVAAGEVRRAHAETAQNAGASVVAAAGSRDHTCRVTWVSSGAGLWPLASALPRRAGHHSLGGDRAC